MKACSAPRQCAIGSPRHLVSSAQWSTLYGGRCAGVGYSAVVIGTTCTLATPHSSSSATVNSYHVHSPSHDACQIPGVPLSARYHSALESSSVEVGQPN